MYISWFHLIDPFELFILKLLHHLVVNFLYADNDESTTSEYLPDDRRFNGDQGRNYLQNPGVSQSRR